MCGGSHVCVRFRTPLRLLNLISSAFTPTTNQKKTMKSPLCRRHERQFAPTGHSWKLFCFYRKMYVYDNTCFADASAIGVSRSLSRFFANLRTIKTPASPANFNHCSPNYAFVCSCSRDGSLPALLVLRLTSNEAAVIRCYTFAFFVSILRDKWSYSLCAIM